MTKRAEQLRAEYDARCLLSIQDKAAYDSMYPHERKEEYYGRIPPVVVANTEQRKRSRSEGLPGLLGWLLTEPVYVDRELSGVVRRDQGGLWFSERDWLLLATGKTTGRAFQTPSRDWPAVAEHLLEPGEHPLPGVLRARRATKTARRLHIEAHRLLGSASPELQLKTNAVCDEAERIRAQADARRAEMVNELRVLDEVTAAADVAESLARSRALRTGKRSA